jgi:diguanylate cyclase (GGDEF)-like protein
MVHPDDREELAARFTEALDSGTPAECTHRIVRADGEVRWVTSRTNDLLGADSLRLSGTVLDVTEEHLAKEALEHRATHDDLTDLPNRTGISEALRELLSSARDERRGLAVALMDLDQFKVINDTLGHSVGDDTIRALAHRLREALGPDAVIARFGGDEFMLVRTGVDDLGAARGFAEEVAAVLHEPLRVGPHRFGLTASIGVTASSDDDGVESLLRDADAAMHQAKRDGRARVVAFDTTSRARSERRLAIETALRQALHHGELHLEYQPVLALDSLAVIGFEALLRWHSPDLGPVGPAEFIPVAEASGLIVPIGDRVIHDAMAQLASWRSDLDVPRDLWMAVNLAAPQLGSEGLVATITDALDRHQVPPGLLHLEITESVLLDRIEHATANLDAVRALGVRISIDDFGTGYSSLSYLGRLPVDTLKIDRFFVEQLSHHPTGASIIEAIVALAEPFGLETIAEGVEEVAQLEHLRRIGCTGAQGFLWSPSLPPEVAFDWAAGRQRHRGKDAP